MKSKLTVRLKGREDKKQFLKLCKMHKIKNKKNKEEELPKTNTNTDALNSPRKKYLKPTVDRPAREFAESMDRRKREVVFSVFMNRESSMSFHLFFANKDSLAAESAKLTVNRRSAGSSGADLTCGSLYTRGLALVPALLCSQEDGVVLPRFQASQDIGGGVSGKLHLCCLA